MNIDPNRTMPATEFVAAVTARLGTDPIGWRDWFKKYLRLSFASPKLSDGTPRRRDDALLDGARPALLSVGSDESRDAFVRLVTNLIQADRTVGAIRAADLSDAALTASALADESLCDELCRVAGGIGTHAAKESQPDYPHAARYAPPGPEIAEGVFSGTVGGVSAYDYMGYSGFSRLAHWWLIPCIDGGEPTSLLEALATDDHPLGRRFDALAPSSAIRARLRATARETVLGAADIAVPPDRQLLMPVAGEDGEVDYVAVTPVPSARVYRAMKALAAAPSGWEHFEEARPVQHHPNNVSGTHGAENGMLRVLRSELPGMRRPEALPIEMQLRSGADIVRFYPSSLARLRRTPTHFRQRRAWRDACELFVQETVIAPLLQARSLIGTAAARGRELPLPQQDWERAFVCADMSRGEIRQRARELAASLQGRRWRRGKTGGPLMLDARAQATLARTLETALADAHTPAPSSAPAPSMG